MNVTDIICLAVSPHLVSQAQLLNLTDPFLVSSSIHLGLLAYSTCVSSLAPDGTLHLRYLMSTGPKGNMGHEFDSNVG